MTGDMIWYFDNVGYVTHRFSVSELSPVVSEIENIQANFSNIQNVNNRLAGNIQKQYEIIESRKHLEKIILPVCQTYTEEFNYGGDGNLKLNASWVNFQKKHEFNPPHRHNGIFSFALYVKVPYNNEDERKVYPDSNLNCSGNFSFYYTDSIGQIRNMDIPVDKKFENVIILFPSSMFHAAHPFYTSDDYRISVSGNFIYGS